MIEFGDKLHLPHENAAFVIPKGSYCLAARVLWLKLKVQQDFMLKCLLKKSESLDLLEDALFELLQVLVTGLVERNFLHHIIDLLKLQQ